jgi:ribosomal protein L16 Arg81 hydroxylase
MFFSIDRISNPDMKDIALLVRLENFRYLYVLFQQRIFKNGKLFLKVRNILETLILISTFI